MMKSSFVEFLDADSMAFGKFVIGYSDGRAGGWPYHGDFRTNQQQLQKTTNLSKD